MGLFKAVEINEITRSTEQEQGCEKPLIMVQEKRDPVKEIVQKKTKRVPCSRSHGVEMFQHVLTLSTTEEV
jgi:hypothetical protein